MTKKIFIAFCMTLIFAACSSDKSNSPSATPLTEKQKNELKQFTQSVNDLGTAAVGGSQGVPKTNSQALNNPPNSSPIDPKEYPNLSRRDKVKHLEGDLSNCTYTNNIEDILNPNQGSINEDEIMDRLSQGIIFDISGDLCPIRLDFMAKLQMAQQAQSVNISGELETHLKILNPDWVNMTRVSSANISGKLNGGGNQSGVNLNLNVNGDINHLDKGSVKVSVNVAMNVNENVNNTNIKITYAFKGFSAIGDIRTSINNQTGEFTDSYSINGESVDAKTFAKYFMGLMEDETLQMGPEMSLSKVLSNNGLYFHPEFFKLAN